LEQEIREHDHSIPRALLKERDAAKNLKGAGKQQKNLDGLVQKASKLKDFSRKGVLHAVTEFIVCDDQVRDSIDANIRVASLIKLIVAGHGR